MILKKQNMGAGGGEALSQKASLKHGFGGELGGGLLMQVHPHPQALSIGVCVAKAQQVPLIILGDCGQSSPFRAGVSWSPSWTPKQPWGLLELWPHTCPRQPHASRAGTGLCAQPGTEGGRHGGRWGRGRMNEGRSE